MVRRLANRSPWWDLVFDALLVIILIIAVVNQFQLRNEINARKDAAYNNCVESNDARKVVANILISAEKLVKISHTLSPEQKKQSVDFYDTQLKNIHYADCSIYKS